MKTFMAPNADVKKFDLEDILTASGTVVEPSDGTVDTEEILPDFEGENCIS